jgi:hypothetical protein
VLINKKAVSTLMLVILMLCSVIFGAFLSYFWVMSNFYLESQNTGLVITGAVFPVDHADFFNVSVMNPSHSPYGTNITGIYLTVEGNNTLCNVTSTYPEDLPIPLQRGTTKTIKCLTNWGDFAGNVITVHVSTLNASGAVYSVDTQFVTLYVQTYFNATESVKHFNVTVTNDADSAINLTLTSVYFDYESVPLEDMTLKLPSFILNGQSIDFECFVDWQGHMQPLVQVGTREGYVGKVTTAVQSTVMLLVTGVAFNETNPNEVSITLFNSADSATRVHITNITLAYDNKTDVINGTQAKPYGLPYPLDTNSTVTFDCDWNWTDRSYRDTNVTVTAYTQEGFASESETVETPSQVVAKITDVEFDLDDTENFLLNVTNMPCSLYEINVTGIMFNQNPTAMNSSIIAVGDQASFTCGFNWTSFLGTNVTITVNITYNVNETSYIQYNVTLPYIKISAVVFSNSSLGNPYLNITIYNSAFSRTNANITQMFVKTESETWQIDGTICYPKISPQGYELAIGTEATIVCPWDWNPYLGKDVTVIVQTADGLQASITVQIV